MINLPPTAELALASLATTSDLADKAGAEKLNPVARPHQAAQAVAGKLSAKRPTTPEAAAYEEAALVAPQTAA